MLHVRYRNTLISLFLFAMILWLPTASFAQTQTNPPDWVKTLQTKTINDYRPTPESKLNEKQLLIDVQNLSKYYFPGKYLFGQTDLDSEKLKVFLSKIKEKDLTQPLPTLKQLGPVGTWSLDALVANQAVQGLETMPNFLTRTRQVMNCASLQGATRIFISVAGITASVYLLRRYPVVLGFFIGAFSAGFKAGPIATLENIMFGWFVNPISDWLKRFNTQHTGWLEARFTALINKRNIGGREVAPDGQSVNHTPKIATLNDDGMNFGYMTNEDQRVNWVNNEKTEIDVKNTYGQLKTDGYHHGRALMVQPWNEEQISANMIETIDNKILTLELKGLEILSPYKTAFLVKDQIDKKERLESLYDIYEMLCQFKSLEVQAKMPVDAHIEEGKATVVKELANLGISNADLAALESIQEKRDAATQSLVTALSINEMRSFVYAEANRNLSPQARLAQRAIRRGFGLQAYVEENLPLLQTRIREMGYQHSGTGASAGHDKLSVLRTHCRQVLATL